jgi:hypothetical protein
MEQLIAIHRSCMIPDKWLQRTGASLSKIFSGDTDPRK